MARLSSISQRESAVKSADIVTLPVLALAPAGLALILYLITCSPTINFTDSGELTTVAWTGSIAHPPGYPLYTLISIGFIHLPIGDPAWRLNVLSALFAALAVGLFYGLVTNTLAGMPALRRIVVASGPTRRGPVPTRPVPAARSNRPGPAAGPGRSNIATRRSSKDQDRQVPAPAAAQRISQLVSPAVDDSHSQVAWVAAAGGLAAAGLLAVSLTFWNWATQAKFYSLHFAFVAGLLWLALRVHRAFATDGAARALPAPRWPPSAWPSAIRLLHFLVFTIGLAITNHFLTFLLVPGLVTLVFTPLKYANEIARHSLRHIGTLLVAGLLPLLLYLYLPIRASMDPLFAWGLPDTWGDFWRQVTAQTYQGLFGSGNLGTHFVDAAVYAANQFSIWLGIVLLVPLGIGMRYLWRSDRGLLAATSLTAVLSLLAALNYSIREIATYYVPLYMIALWWVGLGVAQGVQWLHNWLAPREETARRIALSVLFGALLPLLALVINWGVAGHRDNETADLFVRNAFKNFRPNAVVLTDYWDLTSASFYFQHVLGERPDVVLIDKSLLRQPFYIDYLERNYPDVVSKNAEPFQRYKVLLRQWIDTGHTPPGLTTAYLDTLNGFIDSNLGQRPIYADFVVPASDQDEQRDVDALLGQRRNQLVPDGFGYRIAPTADDRATQDPQFDLRGVTTQKVPLDEIEVSIVALYPGFLQSIGSYLANSQTTNDQQIGARLLDQAAQLQPLVAFQDERPRLR